MSIPMYIQCHMTPRPHDQRIDLRVSELDLKEWKAAAEEERMTLSDWIRRQCYASIARRETARLITGAQAIGRPLDSDTVRQLIEYTVAAAQPMTPAPEPRVAQVTPTKKTPRGKS